MNEENGSRGRGRPPGVKNGEGKALAPIQKWTPKHDLVVHLHVAMHSNAEIAAAADLSLQRVSQILNDPQGKKLIRAAQARLRENLSEIVDDGLVALCTRALEIVRETLELDGLAHGSDFKRHQDRMALEVLKGRGHLNKDIQAGDGHGGSIPERLASRIADALEKSNEAAEFLRQEREEKEIPIQDAEVVRTGDFSVVKS